MTTRSIQFRDGLYERLTARAFERGVSTNWLINKLLEEALERLKPEIELTA